MAFKKDITIYESPTVKVYINQCYNPGKKTRSFAVRRNDKTGLAHYIGGIGWDGGWRQYVFEPEANTKWSKGCMQGIIDFLDKINKEERAKWSKG
ncbi:MAG: hypothetical protein GY861_17130 [bacterium]|nr:hypothetical protein [bacterium]